MLTEETKQKNYFLFIKKLREIGINSSKIEDELSTEIINAPFTHSNDFGLAYEGSLLNNILRVMTPYAIKINESLPEELRVDKNSLLKVCLLIHLSKCITFIKNDNKWEVDNRGLVYKYANLPGSLKLGIRSLILCQNLGITFNEYEAEAMIVLDRDANESQVKYYSSTLATIIKQANELTMLQNRLEKKLN